MEKKKTTKKVVKKSTKKTVNKTKTKKQTKKKGFTLIELLAVIIILGILMIIAIPSVTKYISDSRKSAYVDTAKEVIGSARNLVNSGNLEMYATNTTYYIPTGCIKTENDLKSPYGDFTKAYVGVIYNGSGFKYYWISVDDAGQGVSKITPLDKLDTDSIESDLKDSDIENVVTTTGIGNRTEIKILNCSNNSWDRQIHLTSTINNASEENGGGPNGPQPSAGEKILENSNPTEDFSKVNNTNIYIYKGGSSNPPANYVKFNNENWRIIGIYDGQLKIQRVSSIQGQPFNSSVDAGNNWISSDIKTYLNTTYYNTLSDKAKEMIDNSAEWYVGKTRYESAAVEAYNDSLNTKWKGIDTNDPGVGLFTKYEFLYASDGEGCQEVSGKFLSFESCGSTSRDWITPLGQYQVLLSATCSSTNQYNAFVTVHDGYITNSNITGTHFYILPAVILKSNVKIISGDGSSPDNAYVLELQ